MRYSAIIFSVALAAFSCVKPKTKDPIPVLEFKRVDMKRLPATGSQASRDTATIVIGYQDGDGDLFRNLNTDGPNFIYMTYYFNADSNKFVIDGSAHADVILQPAGGYYKGKSIQGEIYRPMPQFRSSDAIKVVRFDVIMVDMKNHKSNLVSSPVYTITF